MQERLRNASCVRALVGERAAVCTFRVVSVLPVKLAHAQAAGRASVVSCAMRMPSDDRVLADNYSSGGVFCSVDWHAEKLIGPARDLRGRLHAQHPNTGTPIDGHRLPGSCAMIEGCAALHELLCAEYFADAYPWLAWDVSLTTGDAGFHVLEVNPISGPAFQVAWHARLADSIPHPLSPVTTRHPVVQLVCGPWLAEAKVSGLFAQVPRWRLRRDRGDPVHSSVWKAAPGRRKELQQRKRESYASAPVALPVAYASTPSRPANECV